MNYQMPSEQGEGTAQSGGWSERGERLAGATAERARRLKERAAELGDQLVDRVDRTRIEERTRNYPLAALGVAMGVGFILAGRSETQAVRTVKAQLRGLIAAGLIAAFKDEAEAFARDELSGLLHRRKRSEG